MTGMIIPSPALAVWALKFLQKSMMFTPCWPRAGPTGGAGVALPAGMCSFTYPTIFLAMRSLGGPPGLAALLDLQEIELDGGRAPEDGHNNLESGAVLVDLVHDAGEIGEGAVQDEDMITHMDMDIGLRLI